MRILVVDDDPAVLQAVAAALGGRSEHRFLFAGSGTEGFEAAVAEGGVDLLLTDVVMEPVDGFTLRNELQTRLPGLRTVFFSGYDLSDYAEAINGSPVLAKPLEVAELLAVVESELAQVPAPAEEAPAAAEKEEAPAPGAAPRPPPLPPPTPAPPTVAVPRAGAPRAVAAPGAPRAVAVPKATAAPRGAPMPRAVAAVPAQPPPRPPPLPLPGMTPMPASISVPRAPAPAAPAPLRTAPAASGASLELIGKVIGGYHIVSLVGQGRWGPVFSAVQVAINRPVGLKVLDPELAADPAQTERFIADARAKANVQHASILAVYEAGSAEGWIFYAQEFVDGMNLAEMAEAGWVLEQPAALKVLRVAAEAAIYFERHTTPHLGLSASSIYLAPDGQPRLSNPATEHSDQQMGAAEEMEALGRAVQAVLPAGAEITPELRVLLARTRCAHPSPVANWAALLQEVKALEPKVVPLEAARISAQDRAAVETVEKARRQQKRAFLINMSAMVSLILVAVVVAYFTFFHSNERHLSDQVHIPAGDFISGVNTKSHNDEFWIDKYEVTIGQYAQFVKWLDANPSEAHEFDHKRQPGALVHKPEYWDIYYGNAAAGKSVHSIKISLNCPMLYVTWWDAYAYAKWKGRELPTALEWERAARGTAGSLYPWGAEPDPKNANTNADYDPNRYDAKGPIDGFNFWGDVDAQKRDRTPEGVIGLAGNVSEWTANWTRSNRNPIAKGGNFTLPLQKAEAEIATEASNASEEFIGFRTISRKPPEK